MEKKKNRVETVVKIEALTIAEAARRLGISRARMHQLIKTHRLYTQWHGPYRKVMPLREFERFSQTRK